MSVASPLQSSLVTEESLSINGVLQEEPRATPSAVAVALGVSGDKPCGEKAHMGEEVLPEQVEDCTAATTASCSAPTITPTTTTCSTTASSSPSTSTALITTTTTTSNNPISTSPQSSPQSNAKIKWSSSGGVETDKYLGIQRPVSSDSMVMAEDKVCETLRSSVPSLSLAIESFKSS